MIYNVILGGRDLTIQQVSVPSNGFNRVLTVRPHRAPQKYIKKWPPLRKKLLYFFIVAPGRRWHVKKNETLKSGPS